MQLVINFLMKTSSSLVKMISDGENNFMQNKCNKWIKYRNVLPNYKNANMGSSTVHFTWSTLDSYANSRLITKTHFYMMLNA